MSCMHSEYSAVLENGKGRRDEADETAAQVGCCEDWLTAF